LWTGPWDILHFESPLVVQIRHTGTNKKQTVHVDRLAPCNQSPNSQLPAGDQPTLDRQPIEHQSATASVEVRDEVSEPISSRPRRITRRPVRYM